MFREQPRIDVEPNKSDLLIIRAGWLLLLLHFTLLAVSYIDFSDVITTNTDLNVKPNGLGPKNAIWILPILSALLYFGILKFIIKTKPWQYNYPVKVTEQNAPYLYTHSIRMLVCFNVGIVILLLLISLHHVLLTKGVYLIDLRWLLAILFIVIILYPFLFIYKMLNIPKK